MPLHPTPSYTWPDTSTNITWLPLTDPLCANDTCLAFATAHDASQARISWASQFLYGHYVLIIWGCVLGLAMLIGSAQRTQYFHASRSALYYVAPSPTAGQKLQACVRRVAYRRASGRVFANVQTMPNLGMGLLALFAWLAAILLMFVQHPYYRPSRGYGSPPLGVRAGLAGVAMTPIVFALSGKYNLVTLLTGISHERLNFMHRQCGLIYLFFGVVHTVPFLVNGLASGGVKRLYYQFYYAGSYEYTGIAPFAVLVFLGAFSNPWFRSLGYELFVHTHILAAIAYLGTIFWHGAQQKDTRHYLWASMAIWLVQLAFRAWDKTAMFEHGRQRRNATARISLLDDENGHAKMMRIDVQSSLRWTPGQHVFLRFPRLGLLDNHPFTIASVPKSTGGEFGTAQEDNELLLLVRPYGGMTARLLKHATRKQEVDAEATAGPEHSPASAIPLKVKGVDSHNVKIDGPYGGLSQHAGMHRLYDHIILVAGGGGISAMLPWLLELSRRLADVSEPRRVQKVNLIWCIRHRSAKAWVERELERCLARAGKKIQVDVYVTGEESGSLHDESSSLDKTESLEKGSPPARAAPEGKLRVEGRRPDLQVVLQDLVALRETLVMGCGPVSMKNDLSNAVAKLQTRVLENHAHAITLHTETFGW